MVTTVMEHSRFFCYMAKQIESHKGITNIRTVEKVMPQQISSNGFAGGCFLTYAVFGGISPLTCTIFDPTYFGGISRNHVFHITPTSLKSLIIPLSPRLLRRKFVKEMEEELIQVSHNQFSTRKYQAQERRRMDWYDIMRKSTSWEMI